MRGLLSHLGIIDCIGKDSKPFLQGQLTCDLTILTPGNSSLAAHCNVQGRIVSLFHIIQLSTEHYRLILPKSMLTIGLEALKKYAVFSKVTLHEAPLYLMGSDEEGLTFHTEVPIAEDISSQWHQKDILAGIPAVYPETSGLFIPQRLNLVELGGISFKKGCYLGQEILSRLYFKGTVKYHMVTARLETYALLTPGELVLDGAGKTCGHLVDQQDHYVLIETFIGTSFPLFVRGISCALLSHK